MLAATSSLGTPNLDVLIARASRPLIRTYTRIPAVGSCWIAKPSLKHLEAIRVDELQQVMKLFPSGRKVLNLGAGTG